MKMMMIRNRVKTLLWLLVLLMAVFAIFKIADTYAIFETNASATVSQQTGKWVIKLNGTDISGGVVENFTINDFVYTENINVADNVIAPGRNGYFDIVVDPTGTDVAVRYDIKIDLVSGTFPDNISFAIQDLSGQASIKTAVDTYSGVIGLTGIQAGQLVTLRVNITWNNDATNNHDASDTTLGKDKTSKISIPVEVKVIQYLGEVITPYE